jgi:hypothetical protein
MHIYTRINNLIHLCKFMYLDVYMYIHIHRVPLSSTLAFGGVGGLAIGLSARDIAANFLGTNINIYIYITYVYTHIYIYTYITYLYTFIYIYTYAFMYTCIGLSARDIAANFLGIYMNVHMLTIYIYVCYI